MENLVGFGGEYFRTLEDIAESKHDKAFLLGYKSVLNSKSSEESLVGLMLSLIFTIY